MLCVASRKLYVTGENASNKVNYFSILKFLTGLFRLIQGDPLARDPELLSIKNYVIEIMT